VAGAAVTRYVIACKGGTLTATERDRFVQLDGERVPAAALTPAHTVPGLGRVVSVDEIKERAA
jgi:hypothetical protein